MTIVFDIQQALINLRSSIGEAQRAFNEGYWEWSIPAWHIENCFLKLIALTEAAGLTEFNKIVLQEYNTLKTSQLGCVDI